MDNLIGRTIISAGASFTGKISNARAVEVNGVVKADIDAEKITIGKNGSFEGKIKAGLVVVSGTYDGAMDAGSVWATAARVFPEKSSIKRCKWIGAQPLIAGLSIIGRPMRPCSMPTLNKIMTRL